MNMDFQGLFIVLLIGYAVGVLFAALLAAAGGGGGRADTVVVVPNPTANQGSGVVYAFLAILGVAVLVLLLTMCVNLA